MPEETARKNPTDYIGRPPNGLRVSKLANGGCPVLLRLPHSHQVLSH